MPAKPLNPHELAEAAQLKALFKAWQDTRDEAGEPSSQEAVAALLGFGQSALSQYLNGKIPMNMDAAIAFARVLGIRVDQFSPTVANRIRYAATMVIGDASNTEQAQGPKWISAEAFKLLDLYYAGNDDAKVEIMNTAEELSRRRLPGVASNDN